MAPSLSGRGEAAAVVCGAPLGMNRAVPPTLTFPSTSSELENAWVRLRLGPRTSRKAGTREKLLQALGATPDHRKHAAPLDVSHHVSELRLFVRKSEQNRRFLIPRVMVLATFSHGCTLTFA